MNLVNFLKILICSKKVIKIGYSRVLYIFVVPPNVNFSQFLFINLAAKSWEVKAILVCKNFLEFSFFPSVKKTGFSFFIF